MPQKAPKQLTRSISDPRHLMRFLKAQSGMSVDEIAKSEGVSKESIGQSIRQIEVYRSKNTSIEFDLAMRDLVISSIPQAKETLQGLLNATELVEVKNSKSGKTEVKKVDDKTTRLEAMRVVQTLISALQPKAPLVNTNVNTQVNAPTVITKSETTEERMARIRAKAKAFNALPPAVAAVPEHIDAGDDDDSYNDEEDEDGDDEEEDEEEF